MDGLRTLIGNRIIPAIATCFEQMLEGTRIAGGFANATPLWHPQRPVREHRWRAFQLRQHRAEAALADMAKTGRQSALAWLNAPTARQRPADLNNNSVPEAHPALRKRLA